MASVTSNESGILKSIFKVNSKRKIYVEVSQFSPDDEKLVTAALDQVAPDTPEQEIRELFKSVDCKLRTKSDFIKMKREKYKILFILGIVSTLFAASIYYKTFV